MRRYNATAGSEVRIAYGSELGAGLSHFEQTAPLAPIFLSVNTRLETCLLARKQADRDQIAARALVRFADYTLDQTLRSASLAAKVGDGGQPGAISRALFPKGISPVVLPTGETQHATVEQFVLNAKACTIANADKVLGEWLPRIEEANAKLKTALEERTRRATARAVAFAAEESAREDHSLAVDKLMGEVRAIFPKDRKRWDLIFPEVPRSRRSEPEPEPEPEPTDGE